MEEEMSRLLTEIKDATAKKIKCQDEKDSRDGRTSHSLNSINELCLQASHSVGASVDG